MNAEQIDARPPVAVLTGFLGSGKTTLLNRLLRNPAMGETAVIVNEFGEVGIDHALVQSSADNVVLLSSGCLCCTVRGDLLETLSDLAERRDDGRVPEFRRVVVETTGLADPAPILQALMTDTAAVSRYRMGPLVAVVDAVHGQRALDEHGEALQQVAVADRLVLSKTDIAAPADAERLRARLAAINPVASVIVAVMGDIAPERLFGSVELTVSERSAEIRRAIEAAAALHAHHAHEAAALERNRHDARIRAHCLTYDQPLEWGWIANGLDALAALHGERLLRVKGLVNVARQDEPVVIQGVHHLFHPAYALPRWPDAERRTRLVFITRDLDLEVIEAAIAEGARRGAALLDL